ncbi:hypothetical protein UlMin_011069 [Ulmus minor]
MDIARIAAANLVILRGGGGGRALLLPSLSKCWFARSVPLVPRTSIACTNPNVRLSIRRSTFCTSASGDAADGQQQQQQQEAVSVSESQIKEAADMLDIRVGVILKAWRHEEADSLYVEEVNVGEAEPRVICSGLVNYIPLDHLQDRKVLVLANLKPRNMRGVKSSGMLMAASNASHDNVELLSPPEGSIPGERIWFGHEHDNQNQPPPATPNQIQKKKIWELVKPHLKTDESCIAMLGDHQYVMRTSAGLVRSPSLKNAAIS